MQIFTNNSAQISQIDVYFRIPKIRKYFY